MVDARIPERDLTDRAIRRLSVTARHDYWSLMLAAVAMRSDGVIEADDLAVIPWPVDRASLTELTRAGLLTKSGPTWTLARFATTQTAASTLDHMAAVREYERTKKAKQRATKAGMTDSEIAAILPAERPGTRPGHVPGNAEDRPGQAGQDRQARTEAKRSEAPEQVTEWPTVAIPVDVAEPF